MSSDPFFLHTYLEENISSNIVNSVYDAYNKFMLMTKYHNYGKILIDSNI